MEPAESALFSAMSAVLPQVQAQLDGQDYTAALQTLAALRVPVDAFFEGVMVNADDPEMRANRLGLLKTLHTAMNQVADLARLAV
jgi:glycyl-tRNA synthetase beta chain